MLAARANPVANVPGDLCLRAMERLKHLGRYNVVYSLVHGLRVMRDDESDSRLPALKMPMGLIE